MSDGFGSLFEHVQAEIVTGGNSIYGDGSNGNLSVGNTGAIQFGEIFAGGSGYGQFTTVELEGGPDGTTFIGSKYDPHWVIRANTSITIRAPGDGDDPVVFAANGTNGNAGSSGPDGGGGSSEGWPTAGGGSGRYGMNGSILTPSDAPTYGGDSVVTFEGGSMWFGPMPTNVLRFPIGGEGGASGSTGTGGGGHGWEPDTRGFCSIPRSFIPLSFYTSLWAFGSALVPSGLWFNFGGGGGGGGLGDGVSIPGGGGGAGGGGGGIIILIAPTITVERAVFNVHGGNGGNGGAGGDTYGGGGGGGGGDGGLLLFICENLNLQNFDGSTFDGGYAGDGGVGGTNARAGASGSDGRDPYAAVPWWFQPSTGKWTAVGG